MRAFISSELNLQIPESVRWTWAIGFETEDQRELLENYFTWIDSYEHAFPVNRNDYQFESSLNVDIDMTDFIKHMCERPIMYGFNNLSELRANIDGFFYFKSVYNMKLTKNEELLKSFIERWKKKVNTDIKFETWDRPLLKEKMGIHPFTFGGGSNGGWIFKRFVEIVEEETAIKLKDLK
ncbi:hypothetical protein [uncultured Dokdonia sp.]|uniref:hypothetical protein n=1 Tax=uncultured Dokdonia sp. TaxID=575653 RepID=UPI002635408C|nr:hypothetical protein [uncultured Dokdonia sp.]